MRGKGQTMQVVFTGEKQAGFIGLLTLLSQRHEILGVATRDPYIREFSGETGLRCSASIHEALDTLPACDLLISVHGREMVTGEELQRPRLGGINVHPCLYRYKGARPVARLIADGETRASVGCHVMTAVLDAGPVLSEVFIEIPDVSKRSEAEVYNILYPLYPRVLIESIRIMQQKGR